jgi:hypothetical protein
MELKDSPDMTRLLLKARATSGFMLPGLVHNINNCSHVLKMQLDVMALSVGELPQEQLNAAIPGFAAKVERLQESLQDLDALLTTAGERESCLDGTSRLTHLGEYLRRLLDFWNNDLDFKHHVTSSLDTQAPDLQLTLPRLALTHSLECCLGLLADRAATLETGPAALVVTLEPLGEGGAIRLATDIPLSQSADHPDLASARQLCRSLGWRLASEPGPDQGHHFSIEIALAVTPALAEADGRHSGNQPLRDLE